MNITERLDGVIDRAIAEKRIVGAVVIATHNGTEIFRRSAGFADREAGIPVADNTIFRMASVTKPLVVATALALVDWEALALEAPVTNYLPWFTPPLADGQIPVITINQLLTHTAGLAYDGAAFDRAGVTRGIENTDATLEDNMRRLATVPLGYRPGTQWQYSMATDVLGAVIEAVTGTTLGEAVERYVTGPLGMSDTIFGAADPTRLSAAYADGPEGAVRMEPVHTVPNPTGDGVTEFQPGRILNPNAYQSGGGGMAGTAPDFMKFLNALLNKGEPILSPEITLTGLTNRIADIERPSDPGEGFSYFGAVLRDPKTAQSPCTAGSNRWGGIYGNHWIVDPAQNFALVAFTNTAFEGCDGPFRFEVRDAIYPMS